MGSSILPPQCIDNIGVPPVLRDELDDFVQMLAALNLPFTCRHAQVLWMLHQVTKTQELFHDITDRSWIGDAEVKLQIRKQVAHLLQNVRVDEVARIVPDDARLIVRGPMSLMDRLWSWNGADMTQAFQQTTTSIPEFWKHLSQPYIQTLSMFRSTESTCLTDKAHPEAQRQFSLGTSSMKMKITFTHWIGELHRNRLWMSSWAWPCRHRWNRCIFTFRR